MLNSVFLPFRRGSPQSNDVAPGYRQRGADQLHSQSFQEQPVHVGIDLTPLLPGSANGGAKFAVLQFVDGLLTYHRDQVQLTLFVSELTQNEIARRFGGRATLRCTRAGRKWKFALVEAWRELRSQRAIRQITRRENLEVFYSPFGRYPGLPDEVALVVFTVDLLHEDYPESISWKDRLWRRLNLKKLVMSRAQFQVPSNFTRERLHAVCGLPENRMFRTYLPIHERFGPAQRTPTAPFFFYPARPWKHKNHENLLRAFRRYRETAGVEAWRLVLTAGNDQPTVRLKSLARALDLSNHIDFLGEITENQLAALYQSAGALVFPSFYEGFGIPLLEAMHFGLPIVCGRGGSQQEIAGDAALYVDPGNVDELAAAMGRIGSDGELRTELVIAGREQLARFAWRPEVQTLADAFTQARNILHPCARGSLVHHAFFLGLDLIYATAVVCAMVLNFMKQKGPL